MNDLINALEVIKKYNDISFNEFSKLYEDHYNITIHEQIKDNFKFTGLTNTAFLRFMKNE